VLLVINMLFNSIVYISLAHKRPILIFTGDHDGSIVKWEQMQSNNFMYSNEAFHVTELMLKKMTKVYVELK